jgi:hypothetical protein
LIFLIISVKACKCTEREGRYRALVEYSRANLEVIIKGDVKESRADIVNGFRDRVGWLFRKVGHAWIE